MSTKYRYTAKDAQKIKKHGIDLVIYGENVPAANVCYVEVEEGHFQEFFDKKSHFIYYIIEGYGTFVLDDEKVEVKGTDLIVVPPKTRIHYFGKMKMVLTTAPEWKEENEQHIRFVDKSESPYS